MKSLSFSEKQVKLPLAQQYKDIVEVTTPDWYACDQAMAILPDGSYLMCGTEFLEEPERLPTSKVLDLKTFVCVSKDRGGSWETVAELPYSIMMPFVVEGELYAYVQKEEMRQGIYMTHSADGGKTWETPVLVLNRNLFWNRTSFLVKNGYLYIVMDENYHELAALRCDLKKGIMNPQAWIASNNLVPPNVPELLVRKDVEIPFNARSVMFMGTIEAHVNEVHGRMIVSARIYYLYNIIPNLSLVAEIFDDGDSIRLEFAHFYPQVCSAVRYDIVRDEETGLFWMAGNLPANGIDLIGCRSELVASDFVGGPGNDRRFLTLWFSLDSLNWMPAGLIAGTQDMLQSFHYASMQIDGEDLVMSVRTTIHGRNQHDSDRFTFHRIENFRDLAYPIYPTFGKNSIE